MTARTRMFSGDDGVANALTMRSLVPLIGVVFLNWSAPKLPMMELQEARWGELLADIAA